MDKELLTMCCVCKKIKIGDEDSLVWLSREDNPVLYDKFIDRFGEGKISHGYCPKDYEKAMEDVRSRKTSK